MIHDYGIEEQWFDDVVFEDISRLDKDEISERKIIRRTELQTQFELFYQELRIYRKKLKKNNVQNKKAKPEDNYKVEVFDKLWNLDEEGLFKLEESSLKGICNMQLSDWRSRSGKEIAFYALADSYDEAVFAMDRSGSDYTLDYTSDYDNKSKELLHYFQCDLLPVTQGKA